MTQSQFSAIVQNVRKITDNEFDMEAIADSGSVDLAVFRTHTEGSASDAENVLVTCSNPFTFDSTGGTSISLVVSGVFSETVAILNVSPSQSGEFQTDIYVNSEYSLTIHGRRSAYDIPRSIQFVSEVSRPSDYGFTIKNISPSALTLQMVTSHPDVSLGVYYTGCDSTQSLGSTAVVVIQASSEITMKTIVLSNTVQTIDDSIIVNNTNDVLDVASIPVKLDVIDSLSMYGDSFVRKLFTEEVLANKMRIGPASIIFDDAAKRLRFMVNNKETGVASSSSPVVDTIEHDNTTPLTRMSILDNGDLELVSNSYLTGGIAIPTRVMHFSHQQQLLRVKGGLVIATNADGNNSKDNEYSLHIDTTSGNGPSLQIRDGYGDVKLELGQSS